MGSGKFGTPWRRMQAAFWSMPRRCAADSFGRPLLSGPNLHALAAAVKAGPLNVMPPTVIVELPGILLTDSATPPDPFTGSGNVRMPCARMHSEAASACGSEALVPVPACGIAAEPVPPQAATASPHASAAMTAPRPPVGTRPRFGFTLHDGAGSTQRRISPP